MMIMAQHPQQQQQLARPQQGVTGGGGAIQPDTSLEKQDYHLEKQSNSGASQIKSSYSCNKSKAMPSAATLMSTAPVASADYPASSGHQNSKSTNKENIQQEQSRRHQLQGQDGKRTLIKNQLYLIEQLQLENANLRNERDQLQLENEELKFQLQMISSSTILTQPGSAFNDRQLEKLVETDQKGGVSAMTTSNSSAPNHFRPTSNVDSTRANSCLTTTTRTPRTTVATATSHATNDHHNIVTSNSSLATITATPLRQPMRSLLNGTDYGCSSQSTSVAQDDRRLFPIIRSSTSVLDCSRRPTGTNARETIPYLLSSTQEKYGLVRNLNNTSNKFLSAKSNSLAAFNVNKNLVSNHLLGQNDLSSAATSNNNQHDDDDSSSYKLIKLLEQRYGNDSERVHNAAIIIQRAFRKYQICKRFRTITEQLRLTSQSSSQQQQQQQQQQQNQTTTNTKTVASERHKRDTDKHQQQQAAKSPSHDSAVTFASGATRAAAWESLSYAASRLAASAAAATANTKQALVNGVTKSASNQHVASSTPSTVVATSTTSSTASLFNSTRSGANHQTDPRQQPVKSDPVFAAAINFQQLESIRKRQYRVGLNIFNKNPEKGVSFLIAHSFIDASPPYAKGSPSYYLSNQLHFIDKQQLAQKETIKSTLNFQSCQLCYEEENLKRNVAHFLLHRKGLAKEKIGQYLGNLQASFNQDVLKYYLQELDFNGLQIDIALRKFSSTLRLPGEAQKIERFVDYFAQRYIQCQQQQQQQQQQATNSIQLTSQRNQSPSTPSLEQKQLTPDQLNQNHQSNNYKNNLTLLSKDEIFILTFAIIMLNTDLHSPSLKSTSRMSAAQFVHNLRGVFKSQMITEGDLVEIYERVKSNEITTTPDHVTHVLKVQHGLTVTNFQKKELPNLCVPHRRLVCFCRLFEVYDINKKERVGQHQREIFLFNDLLLVTKLARRARNNTTQQYAYRQSIPLHGLYVQLFQTAHYNFGIRLCQRSNDETLIMFNARNELDQSRFVDDLSESIAEMDEMESIRQHNLIDTIHSKQQERLKRHEQFHNSAENIDKQSNHVVEMNERILSGMSNNICDNRKSNDYINHKLMVIEDNQEEGGSQDTTTTTIEEPTIIKVDASERMKLQSKFNSMSNLSSVTGGKSDSSGSPSNGSTSGLRQNRSFAQNSQFLEVSRENQNQQPNDSTVSGGANRSNSTGSVHSLDSGLFISRDVSPNQSA